MEQACASFRGRAAIRTSHLGCARPRRTRPLVLHAVAAPDGKGGLSLRLRAEQHVERLIKSCDHARLAAFFASPGGRELLLALSEWKWVRNIAAP